MLLLLFVPHKNVGIKEKDVPAYHGMQSPAVLMSMNEAAKKRQYAINPALPTVSNVLIFIIRVLPNKQERLKR